MRAAVAVLVASSTLALSACGSNDTSSQPSGTPSEASTTARAPGIAGEPPAAFGQCVSCHTVKPGVNGIGPSLFGVIGRKAGTLPGYAYSNALKAWGKTLDEATLDQWLTAPMQQAPGTKMVFPGIPDPARRKAVIDYLKTLK